jgi:drug/metabolite transporter (DMT)-like permease
MDGRFLALAAAFCFALAATLQQRGQFRLAREGNPVHDVKGILRLLVVPIWLLGTLVLLAGYVTQGIALDVGKLVVVQPLLVTTLVFALPLGHWITQQEVSRRQVLGALIVVVGLAMFIAIGDPGEGVDTAPTWELVAAMVLVVAASVALLVLGNRMPPARKAAVFGAVAGALFGLSATFDKPTFSEASFGSGDMFTEWTFYALVLLGVGAFGVQQLSLATGQLAPAMAAVSVINPFVSSLIGVVIYEEALTDPGWHKLLGFAALLVAFAGAVIVTLGSREHPVPGADPPEPNTKISGLP